MAVHFIDSDEAWQQFMDESARQQPVVVMYSANWCGPCKRIFPAFSALSEQFGGQVAFAKVDVDAAPQTQQMQQIMAMPTFRFHSPDGHVTETKGADQKALQAKLNELIHRCNGLQQAQFKNPEQESGIQQQQQRQQKEQQEQQRQQQQQAEIDERQFQTAMAAQDNAQTQQSTNNMVVYDIEADEQWNPFVESVSAARLPLVVQFGQVGNQQCNSMRRVLAEAAQTYASTCIFARVNVEGAPRVHSLLCGGQQPIPFYTAYDKNGDPVGQFQGARQGKFIDLVRRAIESDTIV